MREGWVYVDGNDSEGRSVVVRDMQHACTGYGHVLQFDGLSTACSPPVHLVYILRCCSAQHLSCRIIVLRSRHKTHMVPIVGPLS
jgi:hypothetical protein